MSQAALKAPGKRKRAAPLHVKLTPELKALVEHAAALEGQNVTDFVLASVADAAKQAIESHGTIVLSARDSAVFADAFVNPKPVNDRLRETIRMYREATGT
jgi:uncharacterized protein (DUF1778 family)